MYMINTTSLFILIGFGYFFLSYCCRSVYPSSNTTAKQPLTADGSSDMLCNTNIDGIGQFLSVDDDHENRLSIGMYFLRLPGLATSTIL